MRLPDRVWARSEDLRHNGYLAGLLTRNEKTEGGGLASEVSVVRFGKRREATSGVGGDFWSVGGGV